MQCDLCKKNVSSIYGTQSNQEMQCAVFIDLFNPFENTEILKHYTASLGNMAFLLSSQEGRKGMYKGFEDSLSKRTHDWKLCQYCYETILSTKRTPLPPISNEKSDLILPKNQRLAELSETFENEFAEGTQLNLSSVMGIIQNNPFRVLGVPIQISSKDLSKQLSKAKIFAEMGKELDYETDFIFLPKITRNIEELDSAVNKIENYQNRLLFSLFWFWERNKSDELFFDLLKQGDVIKALSLLKEQVSLTPNDSNYSTVWNYVVLNLAVAFSDADKDGSCLKEAVRFAGKLMNQELFSNAVSVLLGETYPFDWEGLWKNYIKKLLKNIRTFFKPEQISNKDLVNCFSDYSKQMSNFAIGQLVNPSIYFVEEQANITSIRQKQNLEQSLNYGYELADNIIEDLKTIKNTLGENDFQFQAVTDKAATVILQCAIEYFNAFHNDSSKKDVCKNSIELVKISKKFAIGNELVKRIDENLKILETSFPADPEAEKAFKKITEKAKWLIEETDSLNRNWSTRQYHKAINSFLDELVPQLKILKKKLGYEQYLKINMDMAKLALNLTINFYNKIKKYRKTIQLFEKIKKLEATSDYSFKTHFEKNLQIINHNKEISDRQFWGSEAGGCLSLIILGFIIYIVFQIMQCNGSKIRFHTDELDQQPERISIVNPVYPDRAMAMGIQGVVDVKFLIDRSGAVREVIILDADPPDIFDNTVIKMLNKWKFKPGRKDGKNVETWITTSIRFDLE